ncbi:unnamed protein product [Bemisia tabaci]|uniref:Ubiquitin carboxyl-terminal hydrolase 32 n=1 Tax=Bemisia tabaci TaxID=7038 RepID=A0A9P0AMW7_BEMTA|nr:unnamed protein product [Bemisia tabaci]
MGAKDSKPCCISYEEAVKRVSEAELKRLKEAFKRIAPLNGFISKQLFVKDVLGENVPPVVAEHIYAACGGTARGIAFKELVCGLVLLTRGSDEEKYKFLFGLYSNENGSYISGEEFHRTLNTLEADKVPDYINTLCNEHGRISYEEFREWLKEHPDAFSLSRWLLSEPCTVSLSNEQKTPTFYQTLAGVTHLEESDIMELEKRYWNFKAKSNSGRLDLTTLLPLISPPVPLSVCPGIFAAFDENRDNHIDFKEMACGISAACRGPLTERLKFCFKVFDSDRDGVLCKAEIEHMINVLLFIRSENQSEDEREKYPHSSPSTKNDVDSILADINQFSSIQDCLTMEEYLMWTIDNSLPLDFLNLIFQVCHIVLGLRPMTRKEEGEVVLGWANREERRGYIPGQFWFLIDIVWWKLWNDFISPNSVVNGNVESLEDVPNTKVNTLKRATSKLGSTGKLFQLGQSSLVENSVALDNNASVVGTGITLNLWSQTQPVNDKVSSTIETSSPRQSPVPGRRGVMPRPGPIDNSNLVAAPTYKVPSLTAEGGKLKRHLLTRGRDFELVPESLWTALSDWYGGAPRLPRQVILPKGASQPDLELYPVTLRLLRHSTQPVAPQTSWSVSTTGLAYVPHLPGVSLKKQLSYTAAFSKLATVKHVYDFLCSKLRFRAEDMRLWHYFDEANMVLIEDEDATLEELGVCDDDQILIELQNKDLTWPEEMESLALTSANDRHRQVPTEKGATGLNNLGNTCFMNAALQCVSNTQVLTQYFTSNMHLYELNRTNPLGMKGHIAKRYGDLIHEIWSGTAKTIAPLKLRWTIGKYAPRFNGFQQHDSQELLAFLLDGLHEDLNRVHDKPYVELKDSNGRSDVIVAQEAWENHILRNKSIIVDLFHGQLKSKVTCKKCQHESVRFDPFNYLSLPLPMESYTHLQVIVVRLDGSVPVKYGLRINVDEKYSDVKNQLSALCGIAANHLKLVEIQNAQIKSSLSDDQKIKTSGSGSGMATTPLYAYEIPSSCCSVGGPGSLSGDEERLSINSLKSVHQRDAAHTFTAIQRSVRPLLPQSSSCNEQVNGGEESNGNGDQISRIPEVAPQGDISATLEEEPTLHPTVDSGNCSASSTSLADSTDTNASHNLGYLTAFHRKSTLQDVYFVSWQKCKPSLFGLPVIVPCTDTTTHQDLYQSVWLQVARLVSPLPPTNEFTTPNHAMDCDDSLGYEFPFILKAVSRDGLQCAWCPWYRFCRGCRLQCCDTEFNFACSYLAIDWDPTALHLRYQTMQERVLEEHECYAASKQLHSEPINLDYCLAMFTKEEILGEDEKVYCTKCKQHQLASKKLQIWRLPPILIVHLKRFQFVNGKWVKSQKVVNFPFRDFEPTEYLASVPKQTVMRHKELLKSKNSIGEPKQNNNSWKTHESIVDDSRSDSVLENSSSCDSFNSNEESKNFKGAGERRERLESTSLEKTPVDDFALQDFHQHRLEDKADPFDLRYHLYAIVSHSGILGGGHYVSYACNPNGKWYCYNDSSCKEIAGDIDTSSAYMLFYEREGLSHSRYLPNVSGLPQPDIKDLDDDIDSDLKKLCTIM